MTSNIDYCKIVLAILGGKWPAAGGGLAIALRESKRGVLTAEQTAELILHPPVKSRKKK